jgi:hypothetical protein
MTEKRGGMKVQYYTLGGRPYSLLPLLLDMMYVYAYESIVALPPPDVWLCVSAAAIY